MKGYIEVDGVTRKRCPFCGGEPQLVDYRRIMGHDVILPYYVECGRCEAGTGYYETEGEAWFAWERRVAR